MRALIVFSTLFYLAFSLPASVRYDQTQTGETNIHLDVRNIEIIAVLDDIGGQGLQSQYDDYDYADLTLKPPPKPITAVNSSESVISVNVTETESASSESESSESGSTPSLIGSSNPTSGSKPSKRCGAGFYRDSLGRCRRNKRPQSPTLSGFMQKVQANLKPLKESKIEPNESP